MHYDSTVETGGITHLPGRDGSVPARHVKTATDERARLRIQRERDVLTELRHPNLVELASGTTPPDELHTGFAGSTTLRSDPPRTIAEAVVVIGQLTRVLAELHALGWAHGSVRGDHVIRTDGGSIVLCSLGRATRVTRPDAGPALADVRAALDVAQAWTVSAATTASERSAARRLSRILETAAEAPTTAAALADQIARLAVDGRTPGRRSARSPRSPKGARRRRISHSPRRGATTMRNLAHTPATAPTRPTRRRRRRSPIPPLLVRALLCAACAIAAQRFTSPANDVVARVGTLPLSALAWTLVAVGWYGAALNLLPVLAWTTRSDRLGRISERVAPSWLRRWITGITVVGVTTSAVAMPHAPSTTPRTVLQSPRLPEASTTTTTTAVTAVTAAPDTPDAPVTPDTPTAVTIPTPILPGAPASAAPPEARYPARSTYTLRRGDHLWAVAETTLSAAFGRPPSDTETARYWRKLIRANMGVLVDPTNPDLVYAGQVLTLPPPTVVG